VFFMFAAHFEWAPGSDHRHRLNRRRPARSTLRAAYEPTTLRAIVLAVGILAIVDLVAG
jgi:hypothetical protein